MKTQAVCVLIHMMQCRTVSVHSIHTVCIFVQIGKLPQCTVAPMASMFLCKLCYSENLQSHVLIVSQNVHDIA